MAKSRERCVPILLSCACALPLLLLSCGGPKGAGPDESGGGNGGSTSGSGGSGNGGGTSTKDAGTGPPPPCKTVFTFTTLDNHGRYSPRNVSAVWITDPNGAFVRTLEENGRIRQSHLVQWEQASGGSIVDAVSGATNVAPRAHEAKWDCTDLSHAPVGPGTYTVNAEFATDNGGFFGVPAPFFSMPFDVGGGAGVTTAPDAEFFVGIQLSYE
jgi:hypothetical protein